MGHLLTLFPTVLVAACISAAVASSVRLAAGEQERVPSPAPATSPVEFVRDIQPILDANCYECHGPKKARGQLRLDRKSNVLTGGMSGPAIAPGDSENSVLVRRLLGLDGEDRMPLDKDPLSDAQIALVRRWIDQGATWPDIGGETAAALPAQPAQHWAYVRPVRHAPPAVRNESWARTPIDRFVLASAGSRRPGAIPGSVEGAAAAPRVPRPHRSAADTTGARRVRGRQRTGRVRASRRSPPRIAPLRRALGASMARPGAVRRLERVREGRAAHDVEVPRLGDRGAQFRHALRSVHGRAARRRHAAERHAGTAHRDGVPSQHAAQPGRGHRRRGSALGDPRGSRQHDGGRLARVHHRVRAVPQPQVRPVLAAGLLPDAGLLRQRRLYRDGTAGQRSLDCGAGARSAHAGTGGQAERRCRRSWIV